MTLPKSLLCYYFGQQVVIELAVVTALQSTGHPVIVAVAGGRHSVSSIRVPLEHRTPTLISPPVPAHVVEQDLGAEKSDTEDAISLGLGRNVFEPRLDAEREEAVVKKEG